MIFTRCPDIDNGLRREYNLSMCDRKVFRAAAAITAAIILAAVFAFAAGAEYPAGVYKAVHESGVTLYPAPRESRDFVTIAPRGTLLNVSRVSNGWGFTKYDSAEGWVLMGKDLEKTDSLPRFAGEPDAGIKDIEITRLPDKLVYSDGEEAADASGLIVRANFTDGTSSEVTGYSVVFPPLGGVGEKTAAVWYKGLCAKFDITVARVPVDRIEVTPPDNLTFPEGAAVDLKGLKVRAFYTDGRDGGKGLLLPEREYAVTGVKNGDSTLRAGEYPVTVTYKYPEISGTFNVTVTTPSVSSLKITDMPSRIVVYKGHDIDPLNFTVEATYDNGSVMRVNGFTIDSDTSRAGSFYGSLIYGGKSVSFPYTVINAEQTGIEADVGLGVASYIGDDISFDGLKILAVYNSGDKLPVSDYTLSHRIDKNSVGEYTVTVYSGSYVCTFIYHVVPRSGVMLGDVNMDGRIEAADARLALRISARLEKAVYTALLAADTNLDNKIDASDARKILRVSARLDSF